MDILNPKFDYQTEDLSFKHKRVKAQGLNGLFKGINCW